MDRLLMSHGKAQTQRAALKQQEENRIRIYRRMVQVGWLAEGFVCKQQDDCGDEDYCKDESTKTRLIHGEDSHTRAELLSMLARAGLFQKFPYVELWRR